MALMAEKASTMPENEISNDSQYSFDTDTNGDAKTKAIVAPQHIVVPKNKTLRMIALEHLGNKEFWIYIYILNRTKIKNPNLIAPGITLRIPTNIDFDINPRDEASVRKAKNLGDAEIEKFNGIIFNKKS